MAKQYKFDLTVDSTAQLQANPSEFYARVFGMENAADNYRVLPNVKNATKIANVLFNEVTQAGACDFTATNSTLSAITVNVCALMINTSLCQYELESSYLADQMKAGSNSDFTVAGFMAYFWEQFANKAHEELAVLMWQGDTAGATGTYLDLCDGWLKTLCGEAGIIRPTTTTLTTSNIIAEMGECLTLMASDAPEVIASAGDRLQFKVSPDVATLYRQATAATNTITNVTKDLGLYYLDIPIVVEYGLPSETMLLSDKDNFIYALDLEGDIDSLEIVDFSKTTLDRRIGARADYKAGFYITNPTQIVFYGSCVAS